MTKPADAVSRAPAIRRFQSVIVFGLVMIGLGIGLGLASSVIPGFAAALLILVGIFFVVLGRGGLKSARSRAAG